MASPSYMMFHLILTASQANPVFQNSVQKLRQMNLIITVSWIVELFKATVAYLGMYIHEMILI
jgi:hypothetical protein